MVDNSRIKTVVGTSGGVDSSVSTLLFKEADHDAVGVFMKNQDDTNDAGVCTATEDHEDVRRVADKIGIPYYSINFEEEYWQRVFEYFLSEYKKGQTPNPDIMCNAETGFKSFLEFAISLDADYIIVRHYAKTVKGKNGVTHMIRPKDGNEGQTYFLSQLNQEQIKHVIFPLTNLTKPQVHEVAEGSSLATTRKKDSTGICFIEERNFKKFSSEFLPVKPGKMITPDGNVVGNHSGLMHYTIGQRQGLGLGSTEESAAPWSVVGKGPKKNELIAEQGYDSLRLYATSLEASGTSSYTGGPNHDVEFDCTAKFRCRRADIAVHVKYRATDKACDVYFDKPAHTITPGQALVPYKGEECLGGGNIDATCQEGKQLQLV